MDCFWVGHLAHGLLAGWDRVGPLVPLGDNEDPLVEPVVKCELRRG